MDSEKIKQTEDREEFIFWDTETKKKKSAKKTGTVIAVVALLICVSTGYLWGLLRYREIFLPHTTINGVDVSGLTVVQAAERLDGDLRMPEFEIYGSALGEESMLLGKISGRDVAYHNQDTILNVMDQINAQNRFVWPLSVLFGAKTSRSFAVSQVYDEEAFETLVMSLPPVREAMDAGDQADPENAYITCDERTGRYYVAGGTAVPMIDRETLRQVLLTPGLVTAEHRQLNLADHQVYKHAEVTAENETLQNAASAANRWLETDLLYDWNTGEVRVDREVIRGMIRMEEQMIPVPVGNTSVPEGEGANGIVQYAETEAGAEPSYEETDYLKVTVPVLDEEALRAFIREQADEHDTYGRPHTFRMTAGGTITISNMVLYGWQTDVDATAEALLAEIRRGATGEREPHYGSKGYAKGTDDIGNSYIEIDLSDQMLYLYSLGELVLSTPFVSGNVGLGKTTPDGIFSIRSKATNLYLDGPTWHDFVHYWMPYYKGIGLHDASWRGEFGGDLYLLQGSHGCINLPVEAAGVIYDYAKIGYPVVSFYKRAIPPIADPSLAFFPG